MRACVLVRVCVCVCVCLSSVCLHVTGLSVLVGKRFNRDNVCLCDFLYKASL